MAHAQKPDFVFQRNGRVHLNLRGRQFSRLLAAEVCGSAGSHCTIFSKYVDHSLKMSPEGRKKRVKWSGEKLIPNLESISVIVIDNASYHNVQLNRHSTSNVRKGDVLFWLDKHGIRYSSDMTKAELYCTTATGRQSNCS